MGSHDDNEAFVVTLSTPVKLLLEIPKIVIHELTTLEREDHKHNDRKLIRDRYFDSAVL